MVIAVQEIESTLLAFIRQFIPIDEVDYEEDLFQAGMVNSLFSMQLVNYIESRFQVTVENQDLNLDHFRSIQCIINFVSRKTASTGSPLCQI